MTEFIALGKIDLSRKFSDRWRFSVTLLCVEFGTEKSITRLQVYLLEILVDIACKFYSLLASMQIISQVMQRIRTPCMGNSFIKLSFNMEEILYNLRA